MPFRFGCAAGVQGSDVGRSETDALGAAVNAVTKRARTAIRKRFELSATALERPTRCLIGPDGKRVDDGLRRDRRRHAGGALVRNKLFSSAAIR